MFAPGTTCFCNDDPVPTGNRMDEATPVLEDRPPSDRPASAAPPVLDYASPPPPRSRLLGAAQRAWSRWAVLPLYVRILVGLVLGLATGLILGPRAGPLDIPARLVLQFLAALAPPLILLAVIRALAGAQIHGRQALHMVLLLALNTVVAIVIGLLVANVVRPGRWAHFPPAAASDAAPDLGKQLLLSVPTSLVKPFVENNAIGVVIIAVAFGLALRQQAGRLREFGDDLAELAFNCLLVVLHWVIALVPLAVFGKVASVIGVKGFKPFVALGVFVAAVILALLLQATYYLVRVRLSSWVRPLDLLRGARDALVMAFSTGSSTATMPVTYECLRRRVGLRERSSSMGALVGSNFNNDGTALYEAMAALFIAQMLRQHLSIGQQLVVVLTSIVASVGAAGIPEAGLVTMTLVFTAVGLPPEYIPLLLPVDWFLDRCRTAINVMGDMNVACLLDGREGEGSEHPASSA